MKLYVCFCVMIAAMFAEGAAQTNKLSVAEKRARRKARIEARIAAEGGMVTKPNTGKFACVISCTPKVELPYIKETVNRFNVAMNIWVDVSEATLDALPIEFARKKAKDSKIGFLMLIVDDKTLPMSLAAAEEGWAVMNVAPLSSDLPPKDVYKKRLGKQINRVFAQAAGAGISFNKPCVMEPVFSLVDLDRIQYPLISPEVMSKVLDVCAKRGIQTVVQETYLNACQSGWAPPPTNDIQKALWDRVHSIPDKPIKIEFTPSAPSKK